MNEILQKEFFQKDYLLKGKRRDDRLFEERRQITFSKDCVDFSDASSLLKIGKTIIATKINVHPQPISPTINITVTRAGVSQINGQLSQDLSLTTTLKLIINRMIPHDELEICRPDPNDVFLSSLKLWSYKMDINISVISDDGCVEAASILGFQIALSGLHLQKYQLDEEGQIAPLDETRPLHFFAIKSMGFAILNRKLIFDPTHDEEEIVDGCCTMVITDEENPKLMKILTSGTFLINDELISEMIRACQI